VYLLAPAGDPSALAVPTAALGAESPVPEAFAAGFLPPVVPSLGCGPFGTVLFSLSEGFSEFPSLFFVFVLSLMLPY